MQVNNHLSFPGAPATASALEKDGVKIRDRDQPPKPEPVKQSPDIPMVKKEASLREEDQTPKLGYKTSFEIVKIGQGEKPLRSEGKILWSKGKEYGEVSIKNSQGSDYTGMIEKSPQQPNFYKGFVANNQSAYSLVLDSRGRRNGNIYLKPLTKNTSEACGVVTGGIDYNATYSPQPKE